MRRTLFLIYGLVAYALFLGAFSYAVGFVSGLLVPRTIDDGPQGPLAVALAINAGLLSLFAVQHSVMARNGFKC